jgi:argininosuccinate synthase
VTDQRIVLAFNGDAASCAAVKWLSAGASGFLTGGAAAPATRRMAATEVIALLVDVGQQDDLEELYARARACGAHRVHVLDRCNDFAARAIVPAVASLAPLDAVALRRLTYQVIAEALVEVATIEDAETVAHASIDHALTAAIQGLYPALRVLTPALDWRARQIDVAEYVKIHRLSPAIVHPDRHLLLRRPAPATSASAARVTIGFESGVPRSVNGVAMELPELIESLSLIGGHYHVDEGHGAPALVLLQRAYRESGGNGTATLRLTADTPSAVIHA